MMNYSAGKLCKQSAAQIWYLNRHKDKIVVTPEQLAGIKHQETKITSKYTEMCGKFAKGGKMFYFSWDEVKVKSGGVLHFVEHKQILGEVEDWYLNNSLLQAAIYAALTVKTRKLQTAKFYQNLGNIEQNLDTRGSSRRFYLNFGGKSFKIKLLNSDSLIKFIVDKAKACDSYQTAKEFDLIWKHKEFEKLSTYFKANPMT